MTTNREVDFSQGGGNGRVPAKRRCILCTIEVFIFLIHLVVVYLGQGGSFLALKGQEDVKGGEGSV